MLTYRHTVIFFLISFTGLILADLYLTVHPGWYVGMGIALLLLMIAGSVYIRLGFYSKSYCIGDGTQKHVAFSFDDGPDSIITPVILDLLKQQNIQAVFFVVGKKLADNAELIGRIEREGHILGGHSYSHHFFFDLFPARRMKMELEQTGEMIKYLTGRRMKFFRPPYGVTNPTLARVIRRLGYYVIGWSLKSNDTVIVDGNRMLTRLKKKVKNGDLILFHDTKHILPEVLPSFITFLKSKEYKVVRADQLLKLEAYE
jgi:peptidoglycan/xylan/chitin deacetylase (PgdA/CDA1 family)